MLATTTIPEDLDTLRLPDLQALFAQITGEETRSPNKKYLQRRIREAAAAHPAQGADAAPHAPGAPEAQPTANPERDAPHEADGAPESASEDAVPSPAGDRTDEVPPAAPAGQKLSKLSIGELRARYLEVVGRDTHSRDRNYLVWKIREVQRGRIPAGPTHRRERPEVEHKVLPLRLEADAVAKLDEAVERLGFKTRIAFLREAIASLLAERGEGDVAAMFGAEPQG